LKWVVVLIESTLHLQGIILDNLADVLNVDEKLQISSREKIR